MFLSEVYGEVSALSVVVARWMWTCTDVCLRRAAEWYETKMIREEGWMHDDDSEHEWAGVSKLILVDQFAEALC